MRKSQKSALFLLLVLVVGFSACRSKKYGCPTFSHIDSNSIEAKALGQNS